MINNTTNQSTKSNYSNIDPENVKSPNYTNNDNSMNSNTSSDSIRPKKKFNFKMILGVVVLLLVVLGSGAGFYLSQQTQDLRQQARVNPINCTDQMDQLNCRYEGCSWYLCSDSCHPVGTSDADAGCVIETPLPTTEPTNEPTNPPVTSDDPGNMTFGLKGPGINGNRNPNIPGVCDWNEDVDDDVINGELRQVSSRIQTTAGFRYLGNNKTLFCSTIYNVSDEALTMSDTNSFHCPEKPPKIACDLTIANDNKGCSTDRDTDAVGGGLELPNLTLQPGDSYTRCDEYYTPGGACGLAQADWRFKDHPTVNRALPFGIVYNMGNRCPDPTPLSCDNVTGTITSGTITDSTQDLNYTINYSGEQVSRVDINIHGNFEGPGWAAGWVPFPKDTTFDGVHTGTVGSFDSMVASLVAAGHDEAELREKGIRYGANVWGPNGFCDGSGHWTGDGSPCTIQPLCSGEIALEAVVITPSCNTQCDPNATVDVCTNADSTLSCDPTTSECRLTDNLPDLNCKDLPDEPICNDQCFTPDEKCGNTDYTCYFGNSRTGRCRLPGNLDSDTCSEPIAPMCIDVAILDANNNDTEISVADQEFLYSGQVVAFRCASEDVDSQTDHYEFKITEPGNTVITGSSINPLLDGSRSLDYTIPSNGIFGVQCRICTSETECQPYISIGAN